jgi:putative transcriptional regulator
MKRITQEGLASSLGVTRQTIHAIEKGKYNPSLDLAFKIAKFFETTIEAVFFYKESVEDIIGGEKKNGVQDS